MDIYQKKKLCFYGESKKERKMLSRSGVCLVVCLFSLVKVNNSNSIECDACAMHFAFLLS